MFHLEVMDKVSHKTVSTDDNLFEEKGVPKRYRTEVLPLTSLTSYRDGKPAHNNNTNKTLMIKVTVLNFSGLVWGGNHTQPPKPLISINIRYRGVSKHGA